MPHFAWRGVNLAGQTKAGTSFARSAQELDQTLLQRDIALLHAKPARRQLLQSRITIAHKIHFFKSLASLLKSGVLLPAALNIVNNQMSHAGFQEIIHQIATAVAQGITFDSALRMHGKIFDPLMIQMVYVGQEAGTLPQALDALCDYIEARQKFAKQIRSASIMPIITLLFFMAVVLIIFIGVIPRFAHIFSSIGQELPALTRAMLRVSDFLQGWGLLMIPGAVVLVYGVFKLYAQSDAGAARLDRWYLRLPFAGSVIKNSSLCYCLHSIGLLLQAGLPLLNALTIAKQSVINSYIRHQWLLVEQELEAGSSMSQAMAQHPDQLFDQHLIATIKVGEESGMLSNVLARSAHDYQEQVEQTLKLITTLIGPLLMIILGLLVTLLIFAVYLPIMTLSQVIH